MDWTFIRQYLHWLILIAFLAIVAVGFFCNWLWERRRRFVTEAEIAALLGSAPRAGGTTAHEIEAAVPVVKPWIGAPGRDGAPGSDYVARGPMDVLSCAANIGGGASDNSGGD
jgi:hypothetical protein